VLSVGLGFPDPEEDSIIGKATIRGTDSVVDNSVGITSGTG
jgi:hypothetical protein